MKANRILTIKNQDFILPEGMTDAEALNLATKLCGLRPVETKYYPGEGYERAEVMDPAPVDVAVRVTFSPILTAAEFAERAAQRLPKKAEPMPVAPAVVGNDQF